MYSEKYQFLIVVNFFKFSFFAHMHKKFTISANMTTKDVLH